MTLNRLQRVGVVISILWALGAAYHERSNQMVNGQKALDLSLQICMDSPGHDVKHCMDEWSKGFEIWMKPNWFNIGFAAFLPVILGWILGFIIIKTYKWIKAGPIKS